MATIGFTWTRTSTHGVSGVDAAELLALLRKHAPDQAAEVDSAMLSELTDQLDALADNIGSDKFEAFAAELIGMQGDDDGSVEFSDLDANEDYSA